jgi:hypothetical protein
MTSDMTNDRRAWNAATIDDRAAWYYRLPDDCVTALERIVNAQRSPTRQVTDIRISDAADWAKLLRPARAALEDGRGFVIIQALPIQRYSGGELQALYWLIGQLLGSPMAQNVQGTLLYDVRDTGQDVRSGARFSVTNAESTFHTDNSFGSEIADYVGLLCVRTAKAGGLSQVVSGYAVHRALAERRDGVLEQLSEPFHVDRRGGVLAGEAPTMRFPIMHWGCRGLVCRYLRFWIEAGHEKVGEPLTADQRHALDVLDSVLQRPDLRVEFDLEPGDMLFINNRWIFHNRTAFEDHPVPDRRRHLVRLWLKAS